MDDDSNSEDHDNAIESALAILLLFCLILFSPFQQEHCLLWELKPLVKKTFRKSCWRKWKTFQRNQRKRVTQKMVKIFLRKPHQSINKQQKIEPFGNFVLYIFWKSVDQLPVFFFEPWSIYYLSPPWFLKQRKKKTKKV